MCSHRPTILVSSSSPARSSRARNTARNWSSLLWLWQTRHFPRHTAVATCLSDSIRGPVDPCSPWIRGRLHATVPRLVPTSRRGRNDRHVYFFYQPHSHCSCRQKYPYPTATSPQENAPRETLDKCRDPVICRPPTFTLSPLVRLASLPAPVLLVGFARLRGSPTAMENLSPPRIRVPPLRMSPSRLSTSPPDKGPLALASDRASPTPALYPSASGWE